MIVDEKLGVNFYIPASVSERNKEKASFLDAFQKEKFIFRKYFAEILHGKKVEKDEFVEIDMKTFINGNEEFDGMRKLIKKFIEIN